MKKIQFVLGILAISLIGAGQANAFPLTLTSLSGVITSTAHYGLDAASTSNTAVRVTVTMPQVLTVLSNEVFLDRGTSAPPDMQIALEPYTGGLFLTNNAGFYYDIEGNGLGNFRIRDIATTDGGSPLKESDLAIVSLDFQGHAPNGQYFDFELRGSTSLKYQINGDGTGTMSLVAKKISGYGEFNTSDSGVSIGGFSAKGTGVPEWSGPYSVYWWNNF